MSNLADHPESYIAWLQQELSDTDSALSRKTASRQDVLGNAAIARLRQERENIQSELDEILSGGALSLRFVGKPVSVHSMELAAFDAVIGAVEKFAGSLGCTLYATAPAAGSFVVNLQSAPQMELPFTAPAINDVGAVLHHLLVAANEADVETKVGQLVDDLSLAAIRPLTSLAHELSSRRIDMSLVWRSSTGAVIRSSVTHGRASELWRSLRNAEVALNERTVTGVLTGADLGALPRFHITTDQGEDIRGSVPKGLSKLELGGLPLGGRVVATLHVTASRRGAVVLTSYRLAHIHQVV